MLRAVALAWSALRMSDSTMKAVGVVRLATFLSAPMMTTDGVPGAR